MARQLHLIRRDGRYGFRRKIPIDLRSAFDERVEIFIGLGTAEPAIARERCFAITGCTNDLFARMRNQRDDETRRAIAQQFYADELKKDDARRFGGPSKRQNHRRAKELRTDHAAMLTTLASGDHGGDNFLDSKTREAIASFGLSISESDPDFVQVRGAIQRALQEAYRRQVERDVGDWSGVPVDPLLSALPSTSAPLAPVAVAPQALGDINAETAHMLFARYVQQNPNRIAADTLKQSRKSFDLFAQTFPDNKFPAASISKNEVRVWKLLMEQYPVRAADSNDFKGLSLREIVEKNRTIKKPAISAQTQNKHLSFVAGYCGWLVNEGLLGTNPVNGMLLNIDKDEQKRFPFSIEQLGLLFRSPLYAGCADDRRWHVAGSVRFADHRYWVPLIGLFSGMRLGEIEPARGI